MGEEEFSAYIADALSRIEDNYQREGSGPGGRFEGRTLQAVQAQFVIGEIRRRCERTWGVAS
jgi:hypothetical protein